MAGDRLQALRAYAVLLVVYAAGWGYAFYLALDYLAGATFTGEVTRSDAVRYWAIELGEVTVAVAVAAIGCKLLHVTRAELGLTRPRGGVDWHREAVGVYLAFLGPVVLTVAASDPAPVPAPSTWATARDLVSSALAGPMEEGLLLALVVVLLRNVAARPWWEIVLTAAVLRWSFHIYYAGQHPGGVELARTLLLVAWPIATLAWYWRSRRVLGLMLGHSLWDVQVTLHSLGPTWTALAKLSWFVVTMGAVSFAIWRAYKALPALRATTGVALQGRDGLRAGARLTLLGTTA